MPINPSRQRLRRQFHQGVARATGAGHSEHREKLGLKNVYAYPDDTELVIDMIQSNDTVRLENYFSKAVNLDYVCKVGRVHATLRELVRRGGDSRVWGYILKLTNHATQRIRKDCPTLPLDDCMHPFSSRSIHKVLFHSCAFHGRIDFIEKVLKMENDILAQSGGNGCHRLFHDMVSAASEGCQFEVIKWLFEHEHMLPRAHVTLCTDSEDTRFMLDLCIEWGITNDDVDIFKFFWDKLVGTHPRGASTWKHSMCTSVINEWAPCILEEFLFDELGREFVLNEIAETLQSAEEDGEMFEYADAASAFLSKHRNVTREIRRVMQLLDEIREQVPEGHYLQMSTHLMNAYNAVQHVSHIVSQVID